MSFVIPGATAHSLGVRWPLDVLVRRSSADHSRRVSLWQWQGHRRGEPNDARPKRPGGRPTDRCDRITNRGVTLGSAAFSARRSRLASRRGCLEWHSVLRAGGFPRGWPCLCILKGISIYISELRRCHRAI